MASVNKVILIGRLTRDPETRMFSNGGKVANFGFAVDGERKKNQSTGKWESEPCFLDCSAFNRGEHGKTADLIEQYLRKGSQAYIEGHLTMDSWSDKQSGEKKTKLKVIVDNVQFLDSKKEGLAPSQARPSQASPDRYQPGDSYEGPTSEDVPF